MHISPSSKLYFGMTLAKPERRWSKGKGYKSQSYFYKAINKYGWNNFSHVIVAKELTREQACTLEIKLIKIYDTMNPKKGYNQLVGGDLGMYNCSIETKKKMREAKLGKKLTKEHKKRIGISGKGRENSLEHNRMISIGNSKPVLQFSLEMNIIHEWDSATKASKFHGCDSSAITMCCNGKIRTCLGFIWLFKKDYSWQSDKGKAKIIKERLSQRKRKPHNNIPKESKQKMLDATRRPILQFDKEMNFIKEWDSATTASKTFGCTSSAIGMCCGGITKTSCGFKWMYK